MNDKIIQFPGAGVQRGDTETTEGQQKNRPLPATAPKTVAIDVSKLSDDQRKALALILDNHSFILVAIKPTDTGADFYTAMHGDTTDLRNARDSIPGVIERLYARKKL